MYVNSLTLDKAAINITQPNNKTEVMTDLQTV